MRQVIPAAVKPALLRYAWALSIAASALALRFALDPLVGQMGFVFLLAGILLTAWVGGVGPCLIAQTVILIVHARYFAVTAHPTWPPTLRSIVNLAAFYAVGLSVAAMSQLAQAARQRARAKTAEAVTQREQLRAILSCMGDGVLVTDASGRVTLMNSMAEMLIGATIAQSRGKPLLGVLPLREADSRRLAADPSAQVIRQQHVIHSTTALVLEREAAQPTPIAYSAAPVQDAAGQLTGTVVIFRDESERRQTEEALRAADRRKDEFLATLAHELRNPLAPICMGLELMKLSTGDEPAVADARSMVERQARHMVRLIDDLLDISRITRGKLGLRKAPVDLQTIVDQAIEAARPLLGEAHHELVVRLPELAVMLEADRDRLTQVLSNLLNNAAKYTPSGGRVELAAIADGAQLVLTVADNGRGISAPQLDTIFDMFIQAGEASENGHTGLGLGLTLVKRLVELHAGTVEAASEGPGRGSTFTVRLPIAPGDAGARVAAGPVHRGATSSQPQPRRVLLVDDNRDSLAVMTRLITSQGHDVRTAGDGLEAIAAAESFRPDVVLMDLGMPRMNGFEAARQIAPAPGAEPCGWWP